MNVVIPDDEEPTFRRSNFKLPMDDEEFVLRTFFDDLELFR